mmetsp:Transcript_31551/g.54402  ORF Transcript_31551/g.54402 Transcript_31551/m.54402 type:complete len:212 (+) Transcript_31551:121-756(+)
MGAALQKPLTQMNSPCWATPLRLLFESPPSSAAYGESSPAAPRIRFMYHRRMMTKAILFATSKEKIIIRLSFIEIDSWKCTSRISRVTNTPTSIALLATARVVPRRVLRLVMKVSMTESISVILKASHPNASSTGPSEGTSPTMRPRQSAAIKSMLRADFRWPMITIIGVSAALCRAVNATFPIFQRRPQGFRLNTTEALRSFRTRVSRDA